MRRREAAAALGVLIVGSATGLGADDGREVVVSGRAVCLQGGDPAPAGACSVGETFAIESPDGTIHRLDPHDPRVEILTDERVNAHPLEVTLWQEDGFGKIIHLHTIRNGETVEPYYFCFTCNITSHIPGPCWCCQQEFEFKERPARNQIRTPSG